MSGPRLVVLIAQVLIFQAVIIIPGVLADILYAMDDVRTLANIRQTLYYSIC